MDCYIVLSIVLSLDIWNQQESKFKRLRFEINYNVYHTCDLQRNANPQPYIQKWGMQIAPHRTIVFMVIYIYIYIYKNKHINMVLNQSKPEDCTDCTHCLYKTIRDEGRTIRPWHPLHRCGDGQRCSLGVSDVIWGWVKTFYYHMTGGVNHPAIEVSPFMELPNYYQLDVLCLHHSYSCVLYPSCYFQVNAMFTGWWLQSFWNH